MRSAVRLMLPVAAVVSGACARGDAEPADRVRAEVRDSAGVEIVVNTQPERALTLTPVLRVGVVDGNSDLQFDRIRTLALDSAGGFWVVDRNPSIRHYDATGVLVGAVGAEGQGPGEARGYAGVWAAGGEVLAWGYPSVLQRFTSDGTYIDTRLAVTDGGAYMHPLGHSDGRWIIQINDYDNNSSGAFRRRTVIFASTLTSDAADTVGVFAGELSMRAGTGNEFGRASWFFGNPSFAQGGNGHVFVSDTAEYRIRIYKLDGTLVRVVQRPQSVRAIDPAWRADVEEALISITSPDGSRMIPRAEAAKLAAQTMPDNLPQNLPFVQHMLVSRDGAMWIERADRHPRPGVRAAAHALGWIRHAWPPHWVQPRVYDVFNAAGEYRGTVDVPGNVEPMAVTTDRVYGVLYDSMGVEFVVAYELTEPTVN